MIKLLGIYLVELRHNDQDKCQSIMTAFLSNFIKIGESLKNKADHGIYCVPLHRAFAFFLSRVLLLNLFDERMFVFQKQQLETD